MESVLTVLTQLVLTILTSEVSKLIPAAEKLLPGALSALADDVLKLPAMQAKLLSYEEKGAIGLVLFFWKEAKWVEDFVVAHVHGELGVIVKAVASLPLPVLHLTPSQVFALAKRTEGEIDKLLNL